ncbi:MAG TPA: trypsin-like peptidase domain-containing protein [Prolixibacteraceae bacterium]|jgi:Do/DeqQ family serine protease
MKNATTIILTILFSAVQVFGVSCSNKDRSAGGSTQVISQNTPSLHSTEQGNSSGPTGDFVVAAKAATPAVVHIKTHYNSSSSGFNNSLGQLFGMPYGGNAPVMGSGSGVIITEDGYIATNNHVVENTSEIEVVLPDKRIFKGELVGRDPNTDLALIRIKAEGLPTVKFGNSDNVQVGEWVLAVGYPYSLNTTVTAGIVSAKARSIGIIDGSNGDLSGGNLGSPNSAAIESFIQTDAAINPGNSGGALVNMNGELIGINSAIASQTGTYAGYAFAIPVNLAKKVLDDLKQYGSVKRGLLGVSFPSPSGEEQYLQQQGIAPGSVNGVYITNVLSQSAAAIAGLKEGDIIQSIDGLQVASSTEFSEKIARHRPGDVVQISYLRNGKTSTVSATLKGEAPPLTAGKNNESLEDIYTKLGVTLAPLTQEQKDYFSLNSGVVVTEVREGGFFDQIGIPRGTIIAFINGKPINSPEDVDSALLSAQKGMLQIFAIAPDGSRVIFNFSLGT